MSPPVKAGASLTWARTGSAARGLTLARYGLLFGTPLPQRGTLLLRGRLVDRAVRVEHHAVLVAGRLGRHVALAHVVLYALGRALPGRAEPAATARLHEARVAGCQAEGAPLAVRELLDLAVGAAHADLVG